MKNYFKIGRFVATYGLKGEVVLKHSLGKKTSLKNSEAIFIEERENSFLPYFVEKARIKNNEEIYLKLESINTKEEAQRLVKSEIWLSEKDFKKFAGSSAPISLLGFNMVNEDEELGEIIEVIEQPNQVLCKILIKGNDILIPVHHDSLEKIDKKKRKVFVTLPEGLLDIYKVQSSKKR
jgi:16S rRNA processing protein RimM